jgi:acyl carrier protein
MAGAQEYEAPQGELEETLAKIWAEVLGVERVGRKDNFFELGGHSMTLLEMQLQIGRRLSVQLPLKACFESPSLAALARLVQAHAAPAHIKKTADLEKMASLLAELDLE